MNPHALHELIMGPLSDIGSGWIPKDCIINTLKKSGGQGAYASVEIRHVSGGVSTLKFGTYDSTDDSIQGAALHFALIDECPSDRTILPQCVKRTWTTKGLVLCSFTPEKSFNDTVNAFWEPSAIYHKGLVRATLFDSGLYTEAQKKEFVDSIPPWQRGFSIYGIPSAGAASVFQGITKEDIILPTPEIQPHWKRLCAIDFGFRDDTVIIFGAEDPATNTIYIYDEITRNETDIPEIAPLIVSRQKQYIPMVFPADGNAERGLGKTFIGLYRDCGVLTTDHIAANWLFDPEGKDRSISTGILHIRNLMKDKKLFIDPKCTQLLKEFDLYSYNDQGKFIDKNNHAIDSMRYMVMSLDKFGKTENESKRGTSYASYIPTDSAW